MKKILEIGEKHYFGHNSTGNFKCENFILIFCWDD